MVLYTTTFTPVPGVEEKNIFIPFWLPRGSWAEKRGVGIKFVEKNKLI
jgi:hypothetical protein